MNTVCKPSRQTIFIHENPGGHVHRLSLPRLRAQLFFERFPFFLRTTAENNFSTFSDETSDNAFAYSSGSAGHNGNLIF
jgi:hypothetical protein